MILSIIYQFVLIVYTHNTRWNNLYDLAYSIPVPHVLQLSSSLSSSTLGPTLTTARFTQTLTLTIVHLAKHVDSKKRRIKSPKSQDFNFCRQTNRLTNGHEKLSRIGICFADILMKTIRTTLYNLDFFESLKLFFKEEKVRD